MQAQGELRLLDWYIDVTGAHDSVALVRALWELEGWSGVLTSSGHGSISACRSFADNERSCKAAESTVQAAVEALTAAGIGASVSHLRSSPMPRVDERRYAVSSSTATGGYTTVQLRLPELDGKELRTMLDEVSSLVAADVWHGTYCTPLYSRAEERGTTLLSAPYIDEHRGRSRTELATTVDALRSLGYSRDVEVVNEFRRTSAAFVNLASVASGRSPAVTWEFTHGHGPASGGGWDSYSWKA